MKFLAGQFAFRKNYFHQTDNEVAERCLQFKCGFFGYLKNLLQFCCKWQKPQASEAFFMVQLPKLYNDFRDQFIISFFFSLRAFGEMFLLDMNVIDAFCGPTQLITFEHLHSFHYFPSREVMKSNFVNIPDILETGKVLIERNHRKKNIRSMEPSSVNGESSTTGN